MIEGLMVYIPAHGKGFPNRKKLVRSVKQTIWTLISSKLVKAKSIETAVRR